MNQVRELWKQGKLKADGVFWTEFDGRLRPLAELWLEVPDFELATMRRIQVLDPTTGKMEGPFSFCDLKVRVDAAEVTRRPILVARYQPLARLRGAWLSDSAGPKH